MSSDDGGVGTRSSSATVLRGRLSDGALRTVVFVVELPAARRLDPERPDAAVRPVARRAGAVFLAAFFAVLLRVVFRAAAFRLPDRDAAVFRVDLPADRAPPRAVLRADDLDRLLDDALRLAMSGILVYLP